MAVIRDLFVLNSEAKADFEAKWHLSKCDLCL